MTDAPTFTPGPWHACKDGKCKCNTIMCDDFPVAKVTRGEWGDTWPSIRIVGESSLDLKAEPFMDGSMYGSVNDETATANARLIAAAPALYEALDACDKAFAGWQVGGIPGRPEDILALIAKTRAALTAAQEPKP